MVIMEQSGCRSLLCRRKVVCFLLVVSCSCNAGLVVSQLKAGQRCIPVFARWVLRTWHTSRQLCWWQSCCSSRAGTAGWKGCGYQQHAVLSFTAEVVGCRIAFPGL
jgi:hypothetical protein